MIVLTLLYFFYFSSFVVLSKESNVFDMKIFHNMSQIGQNKCSNTKLCPPESLCLFTPSGPTCVCGEEFILNANGKSCIRQLNYTAPSKCAPGLFPCKNGHQCIDSKLICDHDSDCDDGSDETFMPDGPCNMTSTCAFKCDGSKCIQKYNKFN